MKNEQQEPPDGIRPSLGGTEPFDALLEHARRDAFTPEESERLWQSVISAGPGAGDTGPDIPTDATQGWISGSAFKVVAALVVGGGLLAAGFAVHKGSAVREPAATSSGAAETSHGVELPRIEGGPPTVSWDELPRAQDQARPAAPAPRPRAASATTIEALPVTEPGPGVAAGSAAAVEASPTSAASSAPAPGPSEGALLLRARQELASDPASALALTEEAGRRFPDGALAPEREVLAIEALARLGRLPSARARLAAFRAAYPQSPHLARLASLVAP
jgi:hypothetical protein